ncbi:TIGR03943 family protein [Planosporangium thailandense]|uniref:TIGR03943 family protein n=1 Tax=Planosporangium thailandense TaxID=765197 RepID=A0ABX0XU91_9ACTN|nr:TIGR03943 family protein [Planosporangium thailandense]
MVLLLVGGTLLKIALAGTYVRYVKVGLRGYLVAAGAVLVAVALASLVHTLWTAGSRRAGHDHDVDDGHGHSHRGFDPSWLLVAPALALLLIAPPALGSYAAARGGTALAAGADSDYPPLPDGDPVRISVLDYADRAVFGKGHTLGRRAVTLSGFVMAGDHGHRYLARMVITCCAADARPVKVGLAGDLPPDAAPDAWLEVTGTYTAQTDTDPVNGQPIPYLAVTSARSIPAPAQPYES